MVTGAPLGMEAMEGIPAGSGVCEWTPEALAFSGPSQEDSSWEPGSGSQTGRLLWGAFWPNGENSHWVTRSSEEATTSKQQAQNKWLFPSHCSYSNRRPDRKRFRNSLDFLLDFPVCLSSWRKWRQKFQCWEEDGG